MGYAPHHRLSAEPPPEGKPRRKERLPIFAEKNEVR